MAHKYTIIREHLNELGYHQPLTVESIPLVEKLLSDLIQTTDSLSYYKNLAQKAIEEKERFQCDIEPYKCDNSKLVKECNDLHLELMKLREASNETEKELKKQIRKLEKENSDLQSKLLHVNNKKKLYANSKSKETPNKNFKSKTFQTQPIEKEQMNKHTMKSVQDVDILKDEITEQGELLKSYKCQLENRDKEIKRLTILLEGGRPANAISKDCCYKDIETHLTQLSSEVITLEKEKSNLQTKLKEAINKQHEAMKRALKLADRNKQLEKELRDVDHMALAVEADCNCTVKENKEKVKEVNLCLEETLTKLKDLERQLNEMKHKKQELESDLDVVQIEKNNLKQILENTLEEKKIMTDQINQFTIIEHDLNLEIDRLSQLSALQKRKIAELEGNLLSERYLSKTNTFNEDIHADIREKQFVKKFSPDSPVKSMTKSDKVKQPLKKKHMNSAPLQKNTNERCMAEHCAKYHGIGSCLSNDGFNRMTLDRIRGERDYYCREYQRLRDEIDNVPEKSETTLELQRKLNEKEQMLSSLQQEIRDISRQKHVLQSRLEELEERNRWCGITSEENGGVCIKSIVKRLERERDIAQCDVIRLEEERNALHEKLKIATETQVSEHSRLEKIILENEDRIRQLESERRQTTLNQGSHRATINNLEEKCESLKEQLKTAQSEIDHNRTLYCQLKVLQEQTDKALADSQGQLTQLESELLNAQDRITNLEHEKSVLNQEIVCLKNDTIVLRGNLMKIDQEKDNLLITVDEKTERLASLESELQEKNNQYAMLNTAMADLDRKLNVAVDDNGGKDATLKSANREIEKLRRELESVRITKENALSENRRLQDELTTLIVDCRNANQTLNTSQQEVEDLKRQLQSYVSEVRRIEDLLDRKERERNEMLENFRSLSHEATILENNNHTLENEATENKIKLQLTEEKLIDLQQQLETQCTLIRGYENQISNLTSQIASLERKLAEQTDMRHIVETDLNSLRELCTKLNIQKDTLINENSEKDVVKLQLQRDLERLHKDYDKLNDCISKEKSTVRSLEELLKRAREETVNQKIKNQEVQNENQHLISKISDLQTKLEFQIEKTEKLNIQSAEYFKQIQNLQRDIANFRLDQTQQLHTEIHYPSL